MLWCIDRSDDRKVFHRRASRRTGWLCKGARHRGLGFRSAHSSESKVKTGAIEKVALVTIAVGVAQALNEYGLKTCHVVVQFDWPECQMPIDRQIKSSAKEHGKRGRIIYEALGERSVTDHDSGVRNLEAARIVSGAEESFEKWGYGPKAHVHSRAK